MKLNITILLIFFFISCKKKEPIVNYAKNFVGTYSWKGFENKVGYFYDSEIKLVITSNQNNLIQIKWTDKTKEGTSPTELLKDNSYSTTFSKVIAIDANNFKIDEEIKVDNFLNHIKGNGFLKDKNLSISYEEEESKGQFYTLNFNKLE